MRTPRSTSSLLACGKVLELPLSDARVINLDDPLNLESPPVSDMLLGGLREFKPLLCSSNIFPPVYWTVFYFNTLLESNGL